MESTMKNEQPDANDPCWLLSAMVDSEADPADIARGCAAWAGADERTRQGWHAYHLIGDVLRSEDLASTPAHDAAFLQRLSARLDREPAVLAPTPLPVATRRRPAWVAPAALAASVAALATVLVVAIGPSGGSGQAPGLAAGPGAPTQVAARDAAAPAGAATAVAEGVPLGGRVVRDAQLDRYLRAHRDYATAVPGSLPGGPGRSIATVSLER
jgi:sigma-E factor negative regulatory protein RseA